jgi:PPOX class probable F420-dependent enzyme
MSVIPESHADLLDALTVANVATVGPKGEPQVNPVWFEWDGETINVSQNHTKQKYKNIKANPQVAVSILDPENPYRYLEVRGVVSEIADDPDYAFINRQAKRYTQQETFGGLKPGEKRVIVKITPERTSAMG